MDSGSILTEYGTGTPVKQEYSDKYGFLTGSQDPSRVEQVKAAYANIPITTTSLNIAVELQDAVRRNREKIAMLSSRLAKYLRSEATALEAESDTLSRVEGYSDSDSDIDW